MRLRLVNVLTSDESGEMDPTTEVALHDFWARAKPISSCEPPRARSREGIPCGARVIDLARWAGERGKPTRT
jgi:hypothetical protein